VPVAAFAGDGIELFATAPALGNFVGPHFPPFGGSAVRQFAAPMAKQGFPNEPLKRHPDRAVPVAGGAGVGRTLVHGGDACVG
jgi:hypothetical protein